MNKKLIYYGITVISLIVISLILTIFMPILDAFRIVFGSVYVLFIPGYIISFIFFKNEIDLLERIALSFALSIAIVPLIIFYLNLIGLKISALNSFLTILGIILISLAILLWYPKKAYTHNKYRR